MGWDVNLLSNGLDPKSLPQAAKWKTHRPIAKSHLAFRGQSGHFGDMITLTRSPVRSDPELMGGTLVFQGTRVPAQTLLDYLRDGYDLNGFLDEFPSVERQDAEEFLRLVSSEQKES
jgi:uncharacterized protein (DUF433 family)